MIVLIRRRPWALRLVLVGTLIAIGWYGLRTLAYSLYPLPHRELIWQEAAQNGLNPYLVAAVIRAESGFRADAVSAKGARGLMQIMPATGSWLAEKLGHPSFETHQLFTPETNIRYGTWYLSYLKREFGGSWVLALAAYNGGIGNVRRWLQEGQWDGTLARVDQIPFRETREYVLRIHQNFNRYQLIYVPPAERQPWGE